MNECDLIIELTDKLYTILAKKYIYIMPGHVLHVHGHVLHVHGHVLHVHGHVLHVHGHVLHVHGLYAGSVLKISSQSATAVKKRSALRLVLRPQVEYMLQLMNHSVWLMQKARNSLPSCSLVRGHTGS